MSCGIYKIRNIVNGKVYIGSTVNFRKRFSLHKLLLTRNKHHSKHLQNAWNKDGEENFIFEIIEEIEPNKEKLLEREQCWIDSLTPEYNISNVAGSCLGVKRSDETKKKISEANKKKKTYPPWNKGLKNIFSEEVRKKMSDAAKLRPPTMKGKLHSEETRLKISKSRIGITAGENNPKAKLTWEIVRQIREKYKLGFTKISISRDIGISASNIEKIINNKSWYDTLYEFVEVSDGRRTRSKETIEKQKQTRKKNGKLIGENNPKAKLTWEIVNKIREEHRTGLPTSCLSEKFEVCWSTINRILNNKSWHDPSYIPKAK